ncbi:hypothetical protein SAMN05421759_102643 [Roseivivax lentus]|uniref:Uncharacterized protein n=1 Tax=Roseivivax lentus TaxID=633194 RepID=A0A1N7LEV4_9RHOB|nr:hypothetical protein [Roseivivax lentus]SIS72347.1 hypothetical protein SAMN05421759_102643 [Roseivivax lentus]
MTPAQISQHETRHIFGAAIALIALDESEYDSAKVLFSIDGKGGEVAVLTSKSKLSHEVAHLSSAAPVSKAGDFVAIHRAFMSMGEDSIKSLGDLSDKDVQLHESWLGPNTTPVLIAFGALVLEQKLGISRFRKLSKRLRDSSNQGLVPEDGWPLEDIVQKAMAVSAYKKAKAELQQILSPTPPELSERDRERLPAKALADRAHNRS